MTLGRWRRHTALLERQCQQVYRSSAASLLHLGDRAVARDAVLLDAIELSLHARKEQVFAGRKSGDVRVLSGETGHWLRVLGEDFQLAQLSATDVDRHHAPA